MDPVKPKHEDEGVHLQRVMEGITGKEKKKRRKNSRGGAGGKARSPKREARRPKQQGPVSRWGQLKKDGNT